jgi:hypothetical protein
VDAAASTSMPGEINSVQVLKHPGRCANRSTTEARSSAHRQSVGNPSAARRGTGAPRSHIDLGLELPEKGLLPQQAAQPVLHRTSTKL